MALTALQLLQSSNLTPDMFNANIVDPAATSDAQKAQILAYITSDVLPGVVAEVMAVCMRMGGGCVDFPLTENDSRSNEVNALFDSVVRSFGRSELNKLVPSFGAGYDKEADVHRQQGNEKLRRLAAFLKGLYMNQWELQKDNY